MNAHLNSRKTLIFAALLLGVTFFAELFGGIIFGSLSLLSDSFHVLSDLTSILVVFASLTLAVRKRPTRQMTFGYHRLEVISALFNGLLLSVVAAFILLEAWKRYQNPLEIQTTGALIVGIIGLIINIIIAAFFQRSTSDTKKDVNIQSAYYHIIGDILASVSVVVGITAIKIFDQPVIDPIIAAFISIIILTSAGRVLYKSSEILLHKSPQDIDRVCERILKVQGVEDFIDVRLWQVCSHLTVGTAHVVVSVQMIQETERIKQKIKSIIREEFDIRDITLECETPDMSNRHHHSFQHEH